MNVIEVRLLGPPRVERDGRPVAFDTRKALALLAHLALTDRARPRDALADLLWPGSDPDRARGALRRTLSTLRGAVGGDRLEATRDHVRLLPGPGLVVDVQRFRDLRSAGDNEGAAGVFRGDLLEGFAVREAPEYEDWVQGESENLRRELVATLADLAADREAAGDPAGAVAAVQRWLATDPLHEPAHRELMRLYAEAGDRAAALVQYRDCVRTLSRELGVPPLEATTALYESINRGSYRRSAPRRGPEPTTRRSADGPADRAEAVPMVGRAAQLDALLALRRGISTDGRVAVVEGEAGIGKTRLLDEFVDRARGRGAPVLVGRAYEDEARLSWSPVVEVLRDRLRDGSDWLTRVPASSRAEAARLVPELAEHGTGPPDAPDGPGAEARFVAGLWESVCAAASGEVPGVLVVDDAQWADESTAGLLAYGTRRLAGRPVLLLLAFRTPTDQALRRSALAAAAAGGSVLVLDRLDEQAVGDLLDRTGAGGGGDPSATVHRLWAETEGLPLMLVEHLRAAEQGPVAGDAGMATLLRTRLRPVGETGRQVLAAAAVLGRSFDVETARAVSGRTDEETVAAIEELVRHGLVREGPDDYDFSHQAIRTLVGEETSLARRRLLHARAAELLGRPVALVARHLELAGQEDRAALAYWRAAEQARAVYAHGEALDHLLRAAALGHPDPTAVHAAVADVRTLLGDYVAALSSLEEAAATAGPGELAGIEHRLGRLRHRQGEWPLAEAHLRAALDAVPGDDAATRARMTADLSQTVHARGDAAAAGQLARDAARLADHAGDDRARAQAHNVLGLLEGAAGEVEAAVSDLERAGRLAQDAGAPDLHAAALNNLALVLRDRGDLDRAVALTTEALALCTRTGDRHREAALHNNLADLLHASGRGEEARAHQRSAMTIFAEVGEGDDPRPELWKLVRW